MDFNKVVSNLEALQSNLEKNKVDTRFEKNKLYDYLGAELIGILRQYSAYVAGGLITSLFTGNEINDVDVYFKKEEDALAFVEDMWNDGRFIASHTKKATLFQFKNDNEKEVNVQVIHFDYFETHEDIFNTFDFTVNMGVFDFSTEAFHLHKDFMKHNAQRLLRFNKDTSFPLMSLLRVKKYEQDKRYSISKPEMMRIAMTCMTLDINSYEELKDQLGGLYRENLDKLFEELEDEEFSLDKAIDHIANLSVSDDYFKKPTPIKFEDLYDLLASISNLPFKYFIHKDKKIRIGFNGQMKRYSKDLPDSAIEVDGEKLFKETKLYKFVKKADGEYSSYFDKNFKYKVGEIAEEKSQHGLFFNTLKDIESSTYSSQSDKTLIEVEVDYSDFIKIDGSHVIVSKAKVIREVPRLEWAHLLDEKEVVLDGSVPF